MACHIASLYKKSKIRLLIIMIKTRQQVNKLAKIYLGLKQNYNVSEAGRLPLHFH